MPNKTPLESALGDEGRIALTTFLTDEYDRVGRTMGTWKQDLARFEKRMNEDYSDRESKTDTETRDFSTIFAKQNDTLGMVAGFCDFAYAQAKDDIFGGDEWLAVSPVGTADIKLADKIRKHAPWKLEKSGVLTPLSDGLRLTPNLGTTFLKVAWAEDTETVLTTRSVLHHKGQPVNDPHGQPVTSRLQEVGSEPAIPTNPGDGAVLGALKKGASAFLPGRKIVSPEGLPELKYDAQDVSYEDTAIKETIMVKNGVEIRVIDYNDIVFDLTAPSLDLQHTPVFVRFKIGVLDAIRKYNLEGDDAFRLKQLVLSRQRTGQENPRANESAPADPIDPDHLMANSPITLVEAFTRCSPLEDGEPARVYAVFSPDEDLLVHCDYLVNETPKGTVPVFPVRWWRRPNRIIGAGYHEIYEKQNDSIDDLHNKVVWRDRQAAQPISGFHRSALADPDKIDDPDFDWSKPVELAEGKSIADLLEFATMPDASERSIELLNQKLQMNQMRTGITSASQGELKGVPSANTATGTRDIISRGSTLLKWPIDDVRADLLEPVEYAVTLIYANQDTDETFNYGEGEARVLIELKAAEAQNLDIDVSFELSQTQNQEIMQNSQAAVGFVQAYLAIPEPEKAAVRPLFVQLLNCLGFRNAEQAIRQPLQADPATGLPVGAPVDPGASALMDANPAP